MNLKGKSIRELESIFAELGESRYRGRQAFLRINRDLATDITSFSEFPLSLREKLELIDPLPQLEIKDILRETKETKTVQVREVKIETDNDYEQIERKTSPTEKLIFKLKNKARQIREVEAVWIVANNRRTVCVSSQIGCSLNCSFCATATIPFKGNLETWEILEQVYSFIRSHPTEKLTNVVFMGMGEPFYNYDNIIKAARILNHPKGLALGASHITISTAGVVPAIKRFISDKEPFNLAVSLNHPQDEGRSAIMDVNRRHSLSELLKVCREYTKVLNRRISFEYVLIPKVNMSQEDAKHLIKICRSIRCHLNLIPLNTKLNSWKRPGQREAYKFQSILLDGGLLAFNRGSPGLGINAACGMLALKNNESKGA